MHALIKSEAYYLTHDPVIRKWENNPALKKRADKMRDTLKYTGKASTNIFVLIMQENSFNVMVEGYSFVCSTSVIFENIEKFLQLQDEPKQLRKYLAKLCAT